MIPQISACGRLAADTQTRNLSGGKNIAMAQLWVILNCHTAMTNKVTFLLGFIAFINQVNMLNETLGGRHDERDKQYPD